MLYFAYGSNLNPIQMLHRCPKSVFKSRYSLIDYELFFSRTATIEPYEGSVVEGILYDLSEEDITSLDLYEGVHMGSYSKFEFTINYLGNLCKVFTYVKPFGSPYLIPDISYLDKILLGYSFWGIPNTLLLAYRSFITDAMRSTKFKYV